MAIKGEEFVPRKQLNKRLAGTQDILETRATKAIRSDFETKKTKPIKSTFMR